MDMEERQEPEGKQTVDEQSPYHKEEHPAKTKGIMERAVDNWKDNWYLLVLLVIAFLTIIYVSSGAQTADAVKECNDHWTKQWNSIQDKYGVAGDPYIAEGASYSIPNLEESLTDYDKASEAYNENKNKN